MLDFCEYGELIVGLCFCMTVSSAIVMLSRVGTGFRIDPLLTPENNNAIVWLLLVHPANVCIFPISLASRMGKMKKETRQNIVPEGGGGGGIVTFYYIDIN